MVSSDMSVYTIKCVYCQLEHIVLANKSDVFEWLAGTKYIQEALPYLSASDRELMISNTCDTCWKAMYGEE